jgi:DNA-binding MarR family transcriptional regulator
MSQTATLTGQDVGEAEGALTGLLERVLAATSSGLSRTEYITLRVVAARGGAQSPAELHAYLADQPQLGLDALHVATLLQGLEARGLITSSSVDGPGPIALTPSGAELHASLADAVTRMTRRLYAELDPDDLATAHNVLSALTQRARRMREEL